MSRHHRSANRDLIRYIRTVQEMKQHGFSVEIIVELALGKHGAIDNRSGDEKAIVARVYREEMLKAGIVPPDTP
jgi:hypothetical protein